MIIDKMTVQITIERFEELIRKEMVFELKKKDIEESTFVTNADKALFGINEPTKTKDDDRW